MHTWPEQLNCVLYSGHVTLIVRSAFFSVQLATPTTSTPTGALCAPAVPRVYGRGLRSVLTQGSTSYCATVRPVTQPVIHWSFTTGKPTTPLQVLFDVSCDGCWLCGAGVAAHHLALLVNEELTATHDTHTHTHTHTSIFTHTRTYLHMTCLWLS